MSVRVLFTLGALLAAALPAQLAGQTVEELIQSYAGQRRILRSYGDQRTATMKFNRRQMGRGCDAAVEIMKAGYAGGRAQFKLERLGRLTVGGRVLLCRGFPSEMSFTVSGIGKESLAGDVAAVVDKYLMTPEAYLAERDVGFEVVHDADGQERLQPRPPKPEDVMVRAGADCWLVVYPDRPAGARKPDEDALVLLEAALGTDAVFRETRVIETLGVRFDRQALRALSLWRCEPATEKGKAVTITLQIPVRFPKD